MPPYHGHFEVKYVLLYDELKRVLPIKQKLVFLISWFLPVVKWEKLSRQN